MQPFGIIVVDKPAGATSRQVVSRIERLVRPAKAGHAGTLDPLAVGVLVVCVGHATRLIEYIQRMPKRYLGTFLLGRTSPSDDAELPATMLVDPPTPTRDQLEVAARRLVGRIEQRPPVYSAIKLAGRRAYDLARAGRTVTIAPRTVSVYGLEIERYDYPELGLSVHCGGGTYIRAIGRDLAESVGTGAVMTSLVRTSIGDFRRDQAARLEEITADTWPGLLMSARLAIPDLPTVAISADQIDEISHGRRIALDLGENREEPAPERVFAAVDQTGALAALLVEEKPGEFRPARNFRQSE
jgi:tRNA pseudouridine55 synthase